jgi:hypothetical protein
MIISEGSAIAPAEFTPAVDQNGPLRVWSLSPGPS